MQSQSVMCDARRWGGAQASWWFVLPQQESNPVQCDALVPREVRNEAGEEGAGHKAFASWDREFRDHSGG